MSQEKAPAPANGFKAMPADSPAYYCGEDYCPACLGCLECDPHEPKECESVWVMTMTSESTR
jgi:hypothetical protein